MLFSCCFRDLRKKKQKKKEVKLDILHKNEDSSASLLSPQENSAKTGYSATLRHSQEKHPPSREGKKLLKQKSQESLHHKQSVSSNQNIAITDKRITGNITSTTVHYRKESLPSPPATPKNVKEHEQRCSIPEGSSLSDSKLFETSLTSSNSLISRASCHKDPSGPILTITQAEDGISSSAASIATSQASIETIRHKLIEENVLGGIKRSSAFHNAGLLEKQIQKEEEALRKQQEDNIIIQIRKKYEITIQNLKDENKISLLKATESNNYKLQTGKCTQRKEHEDAILKVKNEANDSIYKMNQQIVLERGKLIKEQQENANKLEELYKQKELNLNESFKKLEKKDRALQHERADILKEVQRLKAEATRMVKLLAMEYEEDDLSEDKKRSLSQEVYSLQLVVEMRTGEGRNLREQLNRAMQQLEEAEVNKQKLEKASARMEDLEKQLKFKAKIERQLSVEKSQMEKTVMNSNKAAQRMSQNVEEMQWRIRNNFELPVEVFSSRNNLDAKDTSNQASHALNLNFRSLHNTNEDEQKETGIHVQSTPSTNKRSENQSRRRSFFTVSPEMLDATSNDEKIGDKFVEEGATSNLSPSLDGGAEYLIEKAPEEEFVDYFQNNVLNEIDSDSLDEGLGDISSDGETSQSPEPNNNNFNDQQSHNFNTCDQAIKTSDNSLENDGVPSISRISPEKERRPSRFSFETTL